MIYRIVGDPPASGAAREEQLRWVRRFYGFTPIAIVMVVVFALMDGSAFLWIVAAVVAITWVSGLASITMSIRKASSKAAGDRLSE